MTEKELLESQMRAVAYYYANDNIHLAEEYARFLSEAKDDDEYNIREQCLTLRRGQPIGEIKSLFAYLVNGTLND